MDKNDGPQKKSKKQQEPPLLRSCEKCTKFFTSEQNYQTHLKMKHQDKQQQSQEEQQGSEEPQEQQEQEDQGHESNPERKGQNKNVPMRGRMLQIQRNQLEDNIYTFLGELGEKNLQPTSNRTEIINFSSDQKLTGQTNYSVNKVIRTPYEEPIKCTQEIDAGDFAKSRHQPMLQKLRLQMITLESKVQEQRDTWQLRDPMAPQEEVADQFSLMDMKKLIQNYPKRNLNLDYPNFSIFLLWVGRICKSPAFKEFYLILGQYLGDYYAVQANRVKGDPAYSIWKSYHRGFEAKKVTPELLAELRIFDEKSCKKFVEYFVSWSDIFKALSI